MKKYFTLVLVLSICCFFIRCSHAVYPTGTYRKTAVTADGDLNEWERPLRFISNGGFMQYNVMNDNDNLYIALETHDDATAEKILRTGVHIYIDPAGGESKKISLAFPLPNEASLPPRGIPGSKTYGIGHGSRADSFSIAGFRNITDGRYASSDQSKLKIALKTGTDNSLAYEAVIPLQYIFDNASGGRNAGQQISVGIIINAMKVGASTRSAGNGEHSGGMSTGGHSGGMHGGGGRGGSGGSHRSSSGNTNQSAESPIPDSKSSLTKQDYNWYKFKLAGK